MGLEHDSTSTSCFSRGWDILYQITAVLVCSQSTTVILGSIPGSFKYHTIGYCSAVS